MSAHYCKFETFLPRGARILDAGCGSGRDSLYFKTQGYDVEAFDASEEMVRFSTVLTGLPVKMTTFEEAAYDYQFQGIWACASLLHIEKAQIVSVISRLSKMLFKGGAFFASFKKGNSDYGKEGRIFSCFTEESFNVMIQAIPELSISDMYVTTDVRTGRKNEEWLSAILIKN
jgi:SAM-dependent methyltransferase